MTGMINSPRFYRIFFYVLLAVTAVGAIAWLTNTWYYSDDYYYMHAVLPGSDIQFWLCRGELITEPGQLWDNIVLHHDYINGRLCNFVMFALNLIPRGPVCFVNGLILTAMLFMLLVMGRIGRRRVTALWMCLAVILLWTAFPWYDQFQSIDFFINYVPTSVLFMSALYSCRRASTDRRWLWGAVLFTFFTAWMHESFATVMLAVLFFDFLFAKQRRRADVFAGVAAIIGLIVCVSSGTVSRAGGILGAGYDYTFWSSYLRLASQGWSVLAAIFLFIIYIVRHPVGWRTTAASVIPFLAGALVGAAQCEVLMSFDRALWPAQLCATIAILIIVSQWRGRGKPSDYTFWGCAVFTLLYAAWLALVAVTQVRVAAQQREYDRLCAEAAAEGRSIVCADLEFFDTPWIVGGLACNDIIHYVSPIYINARAQHFGFPDEYYLTMPACFRNKPFAGWDTIPGTAGLRGRWPFVAGPFVPNGERDTIFDTYEARFDLTFGAPAPSCPIYERLKIKVKENVGMETPVINLAAAYYPINLGDTIVAIYLFYELPARYYDLHLERIDLPVKE